MIRILILFFILSGILSCEKKRKTPEEASSFTLHLFTEPSHLNPSQMRASSASYFFQNTLRGLYRFDEKKGLVEEGGHCHYPTPLELQCEIKNQYWSNGEAVTNQDYIKNIHLLIDPKNASPRADILAQIKNVKKILTGELKPQDIGVHAIGTNILKFEFESPDSEFLFKLASTALVPLHKDHPFSKDDYKKFITNGPYQISSWAFGKELVLKPNPYFKKGHPLRPLVKFYFIEDEMTAYRLYLNNQLSFLRRVPSQLLQTLKTRKDLYFVPMARFDYIGFGNNVAQDKNFRLALIHSINYAELKTLLHALGRPGCPSLPSGWIDNPPCFEYSIEKAKKYLSLAKIDTQKLKLKVSQLGGEDIKKQAEFFQNQWKKNLNIQVEINQVEQKVYIQELQNKPPDIFRKGVGLDLPTCLNALETFAPQGKQNYLAWNNKDYSKILTKLRIEKDSTQYKQLCRKAVALLMNDAALIPLGEMHFSFLASPKFTGWSLNSMNQLDLSQLHPQL